MELVTTAQAADQLGVSLRTLHRMIEAGDLTPSTKLPTKTGSYLFTPDAVADAVQRREQAKAERSEQVSA